MDPFGEAKLIALPLLRFNQHEATSSRL